MRNCTNISHKISKVIKMTKMKIVTKPRLKNIINSLLFNYYAV